jgi:hypothetical protein
MNGMSGTGGKSGQENPLSSSFFHGPGMRWCICNARVTVGFRKLYLMTE